MVAGHRVLGLFGGADQAIPVEDIAAFGAALSAAGVDNRLVTYPGAPHSFFDRKAAEFGQASEVARRKITAFIEKQAFESMTSRNEGRVSCPARR